MHERMTAQLERQLGYLSRSCKLFDLDYLDEAIRIALCLRILFHDKRKDSVDQGSILKLLGKQSIQLLTTCEPFQPLPGTSTYDGYVHLPGNIRPWNEYLNGPANYVSVGDWLNQVIFVAGGARITRNHLILSAAEKDGGAHADSTLPSDYKSVMRMWNQICTDELGNTNSIPMVHNHLFALRRFGLEVLNSPDLVALCRPDQKSAEVSDDLYRAPSAWQPVLGRAIDIAAYRLKARGLADKKQHAEAARTFIRPLELLDEIRLSMLIERGSAHIHAGDATSAIADFNSALAMSPDNITARYGLGFALMRQKKFADAERQLTEAVRRAPGHAPAHLALADLYYEMGRFQEALETYDRTLTLDPKNTAAKNNRAATEEAIAGSKR